MLRPPWGSAWLDQDRAKVVDVGQRGPGDHGIAQRAVASPGSPAVLTLPPREAGYWMRLTLDGAIPAGSDVQLLLRGPRAIGPVLFHPPQAAPQPWGQPPQQGYREPPRYKDDRHRDDEHAFGFTRKGAGPTALVEWLATRHSR